MAFSVELYKEVEKLEPALRSVMQGIMSELEVTVKNKLLSPGLSLFISPFIDPRGTENLAQALGIMLCTDPKRLKITP